jgi:hypothetical protein
MCLYWSNLAHSVQPGYRLIFEAGFDLGLADDNDAGSLNVYPVPSAWICEINTECPRLALNSSIIR